jgi:peptide/nickel transport system permease protein
VPCSSPWIAPQNPFDPAVSDPDGRVFKAAGEPNQFTGETFVLGTDDQGRDIFSTIIYGCAFR